MYSVNKLQRNINVFSHKTYAQKQVGVPVSISKEVGNQVQING